jgi:hypothetical protein
MDFNMDKILVEAIHCEGILPAEMAKKATQYAANIKDERLRQTEQYKKEFDIIRSMIIDAVTSGFYSCKMYSYGKQLSTAQDLVLSDLHKLGYKSNPAYGGEYTEIFWH